VRERRYQTYPNQWGKGNVHRYLYDSVNKLWYVACRSPGHDPHGRRVDDDTPVTCKKCSPGL